MAFKQLGKALWGVAKNKINSWLMRVVNGSAKTPREQARRRAIATESLFKASWKIASTWKNGLKVSDKINSYLRPSKAARTYEKLWGNYKRDVYDKVYWKKK